MINRYTRPDMAKIWSLENKFQALLKVEIAVAQAQSEVGLIPKKAYLEIKKKAKFAVDRIAEIEHSTKHDVIAFVQNVAENVGPMGAYLHFGMTSSDVLDTAHSLLVREAFKLLDTGVVRLEKALIEKVKAHQNTLCAGRTHGIHAEPMSFGRKLESFLEELKRNRQRLKIALEQSQIVKLSGPVGTYSTQPAKIEKRVGELLKLQPENVATQVVPRDRYAQVIISLAFLGANIERLAVELRHLQRTEVDEVQEGFTKGQKGSSAMPHKKNPIGSENLTGLSRLLRSYVGPSLENIVLWHERDISHSSVERVIFADAFILADYATNRMADIVENLVVKSQNMKRNLGLTRGQIFSSQLLLALIQRGYNRTQAYEIIQQNAHKLTPNQHLMDVLWQDERVNQILKKQELTKIFEGRTLIASSTKKRPHAKSSKQLSKRRMSLRRKG